MTDYDSDDDHLYEGLDFTGDWLPEKFQHIAAELHEIRDRDCLHGGPPPTPELARTKIATIQECMVSFLNADKNVLLQHAHDNTAAEDLTGERSMAKLNCLLKFWSSRPADADINEEYPALLFSMATDATLDNNLEYARSFLQVGIFMRAWCRLGKDVFVGAFASHHHRHHHRQEELLPAAVEKLYANCMYKTRTNRGMVIFLNKRTPCNCLEQLATQEKAKPRTRKCNYCKTEGAATKLMKCSRCGLAEYCSKACQRSDWKVHKRDCIKKR